MPKKKPSPSIDINEMADSAMALGVWKTREEFLYHFNPICQLMADRLLNDDKPVDLGFIKLHSVPYCPNWKEALSSWIRQRIGYGGNMKRPDAFAHDIDLSSSERALFADMRLLALNDQRSYICFRVEAEHSNKWWKMVHEVECNRLKNLGKDRYGVQIVERIISGMSRWITLYRQWAAFISHSARAGRIYNDARFYGDILILSNKRGKYRFFLPDLSAGQLTRLTEDQSFMLKGAILKTDSKLQEVPGVQSETTHMRKSPSFKPGDVVKPEDQAT